jgi:hypothetical protein
MGLAMVFDMLVLRLSCETLANHEECPEVTNFPWHGAGCIQRKKKQGEIKDKSIGLYLHIYVQMIGRSSAKRQHHQQ